jgi:K+-sensing histidine kinase KdpD
MRIGNTGPCVPLKEQDRIFDRFYRGASFEEIGLDGMGLGLSLCREILRAHGGELSLEKSDHDRTVFLIKLKSTENDS